MLNKKTLVILGLVLAALIVVIVASQLLKSPSQEANENAVETENSPGTETDQEAGVQKPYSGPVSPKAPAYSGRPLGEARFGVGFSAPQETIDKRQGDLKVLAAVLTANPRGVEGANDWIAVGVIKKFFNDYEGARDAWEYAGVLYPANALSFANLGNLYGFYLHDNAKAELNFRKAIANDPYQPAYYIGLADFYKNVYAAKKSESPRVLLEGMGIIKDVNLTLALASYYRDEGDKANAIKYYEEVLKLSPDHPEVKEEIGKLKISND